MDCLACLIVPLILASPMRKKGGELNGEGMDVLCSELRNYPVSGKTYILQSYEDTK